MVIIKKESVYTLPNLITFIRLILLPFFIYALVDDNNQLALFFFAIIIITDKLDGYWARLTKQMTEIGKMLDGIADGLIFFAALAALAMLNRLSLIWAIVLITPKIVTFVSSIFYVKKQKKLAWNVLNKGRVSTGLMYISLVMLIMEFEYTFFFLITTSAVLYLSAIDYVEMVFFRKKKH